MLRCADETLILEAVLGCVLGCFVLCLIINYLHDAFIEISYDKCMTQPHHGDDCTMRAVTFPTLVPESYVGVVINATLTTLYCAVQTLIFPR